MTISTQKKAMKGRRRVNRHYRFGGPHYPAILNFSNPDEIEVKFLTPSKKSYYIPWNRIKNVDIRYLIA